MQAPWQRKDVHGVIVVKRPMQVKGTGLAQRHHGCILAQDRVNKKSPVIQERAQADWRDLRKTVGVIGGITVAKPEEAAAVSWLDNCNHQPTQSNFFS